LTAHELLADDYPRIVGSGDELLNQYVIQSNVCECGNNRYGAGAGGPVKIGSYLRVGFNTTLNIILYAATTGQYLWLEGRVRRGVFRNWARRFRYAPITYAEPSNEEEIVKIVRDCAKVRVFGSGHSFNEGDVSDQVLISLDNWFYEFERGVTHSCC
jgi:hypothetical protein